MLGVGLDERETQEKRLGRRLGRQPRGFARQEARFQQRDVQRLRDDAAARAAMMGFEKAAFGVKRGLTGGLLSGMKGIQLLLNTLGFGGGDEAPAGAPAGGGTGGSGGGPGGAGGGSSGGGTHGALEKIRIELAPEVEDLFRIILQSEGMESTRPA